MARLARVVGVGMARHVTQRGNARQVVFQSDVDRAVYLELLRRSAEHYDAAVLGYCLMSNHVHMILVPHNGNIVSWSASGGTAFNRAFTYDELNRLKALAAPAETCSGLSWSYDVWGNRTAQTTTGGTCPQLSLSFDANNRVTGLGYIYDAAGNVTYDPTTNATYQWDAEGRMISSSGTLGSAAYVYDPEGRRVTTTVGGVNTVFLYNAAGVVVAESNGTDTMQKGYAYLGGQMLAQYSGGTT